MDDLVVQELLFEASPYRSEILKDIDQNFASIKKDRTDLAAKKELTENVKKFSGVDHIVITFKKDYFNAAVIPIYNQAVSADLIDVFKDFEGGGNLKSLSVVEEPSKYIKKLYIIFGDELIETFSPRELTAILLHEFGHAFTYTANLPRILLMLFQKSVGIIGIIIRTPVLWLFNLVSIPAYLISSLIIITVVRSLTFIEHRSEYKADQFAIKYGYSDEMIKVLYKLHNKQKELDEHKKWWEKVWKFIDDLFSPSSHPSSSRRIEEINNHMLTEYKKLYPKLSNELNIILKDIKSSS
jgi:hypothetical protein